MENLMKKLSLLTLTAAALVLSANAYAGHGGKCHGMHGKHKDKMFTMIDTNNDGAITREEQAAFSDKKFNETDANGDGKVTKEEMKAHFEKKRAEWKAKKAETTKLKSAQ